MSTVTKIEPTTVLIVDDQQLMRVGLRMVLDSHKDISVVGEAGDGAAAVRAAQQLHPAVVLMDIRMSVLDGVEATRQIVRAECSKVLVMTTFDLDEYALAALRAGASGFLLKDTPPEQLVAAVRSVASGDSVVSPSVTRRLLDRFVAAAPELVTDTSALDVLTDREREVLEHMARGRSNAEIAEALFLSEATIKSHVGKVLAKLGLRGRVQAVVLAYETGMVRPGT